MPTQALTDLSIANATKTPKVGDVRSKRGGYTTYYTKNNLKTPARTETPVITPESLKPAAAPVVSPTPTLTEVPKLQADLMTQQEDALAQKVAADKTAAEASKGTALSDYLKTLTESKGLSTLQAEAYAAPGGVNAITPELNDINDQIRREQRSLDLAKRRIQESGGGLEAGAIAEQQNLERVSLQKQADLSIIQMAVQGRYDSAKEIADRAVAAQFEEQTKKTDIAKFDYEENKDLFTKAEQREYDLLFADRNAKLEKAKQDAADIKSFALSALQAGASVAEVQKAMGAKTLDEAISLVGGYLRPKVTATGAAAPTIKTINGVDYQWNEETGEWEVPAVGGAATGAGGQSLENLETKYTELLADIGDAQTLVSSGAAGAGGIERFVKGLFTSNADYKQLENIADTIKSNLLTLNTDPAIKKFFGPQMSNRDTELMTGAASTLNPDKQTPEQIRRDLQDAAGVIARAREAVRVGLGQGSGAGTGVAQNIILAPDGTSIEIID